MFFVSCAAVPARRPTVIISERREINERAAVGQARVFAAPSPHNRLAGARAWLAIAKALVEEPSGAYRAALRGVTELGTDYAKAVVRDHTIEDEWFAKQDFEQRKDEGAAELMIGVLDHRIKMYRRRYEAEVE
ncbi:MAG: hypothetical protein HOV81_10895 [Kofleriaceae bacterium]|nr:hypothetical protein [Kofleriaceae bacterium]